MAATWGPDSSKEPLPVKTVSEVIVEELEKWFDTVDEEDE